MCFYLVLTGSGSESGCNSTTRATEIRASQNGEGGMKRALQLPVVSPTSAPTQKVTKHLLKKLRAALALFEL